MCTRQKLMYQFRKGAIPIFVKYYTLSSRDLDIEKVHNSKLSAIDRANGARFFLSQCGQCIECRMQNAREKATRILLECKTSFTSWSVTLTYDDEHLVYNAPIRCPDGSFSARATLVPDHLKKFMKDLRRYCDYHYNLQNIRFFACGEYGSRSARPHYHLILFNFDLPDIKLSREKSDTGELLYESDTIARIWSRGRVRLNEVNWDYACYCARYILKKQVGKNKDIYDQLKIEPEFCRSSNRPGLGYDYFMANQGKLLDSDKVLIKRALKVEYVPLPKYFLRKAEEEGFDLTELKLKRQDNAIQNALKIQESISEDYFDYKKKQEEILKSSSKGLIRNDH